MSRYYEEPVNRTPDDSYGREGTRDTHPAFGVVVIQRPTSTPGQSLFQSDLRHTHTMRLTIHTAERTRALNTDWVHPTRELIEVEMSLAQWGEMVSSVGMGGGTPVTIRRTESDPFVPLIPHEPRLQESMSEVDGAMDALLERIYDTLAGLQVAIEEKQGVKAVREALRAHSIAVQHAKGSAKFAVDSLREASEKVVSAARADIEAHIIRAQGAIEMPELETMDARAVEATDEPSA